MENLKKFDNWIKDDIKRRWNRFKDEMHPWDFSREEWKQKYREDEEIKAGKTPVRAGKKPVKPLNPGVDPYGEDDWNESPDTTMNASDLPRNPYEIGEFNRMIREEEISRTRMDDADFVWYYKNGKVVYFKNNV